MFRTNPKERPTISDIIERLEEIGEAKHVKLTSPIPQSILNDTSMQSGKNSFFLSYSGQVQCVFNFLYLEPYHNDWMAVNAWTDKHLFHEHGTITFAPRNHYFVDSLSFHVFSLPTKSRERSW